jgi:tartrate dehydratase alpha subunit/fumarate hydratase class I-like protein
MLNPSDSIVDWVVETVPTMGAGWCPPGITGPAHWREKFPVAVA